MIAGVGVSWYTWLEQGRDIRVSAQVLDAVSRALRLDGHERAYLHRLAGLNPPTPAAGSVPAINPELRRMLDAWLPRPAYILDRHWGLAAINATAREVFGLGDQDHNCLVSFFTSSRYRAAYTDWERVAPDIVAHFRADAAWHQEDQEFHRLAAELSLVSEEFARLWARHEVSERTQGTKLLTHPALGALHFEYTRLPLPDHSGHRMILHNAIPGTGTEEKLPRLAKLAEAAAVAAELAVGAPTPCVSDDSGFPRS